MNLFPQTTNTDMEAFKIHYGGQTNQIDANTYINSLLHFTNIVEEANKELSPESKIKINISAHEEGSFVTDIVVLAQTTLEHVVNSPTVQTAGYVKTLMELVGGVYSLAKFLRGKNPKSVESVNNSVTITKNDGNVTYIDKRVFNIYQNKSVRNSLSQEFETLNDDENVTSFELLDSSETPIVEVEREFFAEIADDEGVELTNNEQLQEITTTLNIVALDLELKKKWDFYYKGHKISAKVKDESFRDRINKGERFGKGDSLEVEMQIRQEFDESVNTYINKSYVITKIIKHIEKPQQGNLGV